jgi:PAS domain S-box-containing protein
MQHQKVIEQLGYSSNEARVYLASLTLGEAHISDITEQAHMPRSTVQAIVERLHEDGLMHFYLMRHHKYWVADEPTKLLMRLKKREEQVSAVIPELIALQQKARHKTISKQCLEDIAPLQEVANGMHQPVLIADHEAEIRYVNAPWQQLLGYTVDEIRGAPASILKSGQTPARVFRRMWRTLKVDAVFTSNEIVNLSKNGDKVAIFTIIFPVQYGNRKFYMQIAERLPEAHTTDDAPPTKYIETKKE